MSRNRKAADAGADEFVFLPLGGSGEIGMNLNLYGYGPERARKWIIVDCGVTFGDLSTPGVEVILPDPAFIEERADDLLAIVLTHAHEDHMGAVARLWPRLRAPIYATPFTMYLVKDRLEEAGLLGEARLHLIDLKARFKIGPFDLELVTLTHSIPEPNGIAIRTPAGMVLHTGDWKIDPDPLIGEATDVEALKAIGDEGVLAMVCDSTNVFVPGSAGSEADVREALIELVGRQAGKVALAAFASNVARMATAVKAAEANGRTVCLVGRSMHRMAGAAKSVGLLADAKPFASEEEAGYLPADKVLYLCTGSQGEPRAALSRIASGSHRHVRLGEGDTVIFSSRVIPGNEIPIRNLQNALADRGVKIVTERGKMIHVSGHPCRDELAQMYAWARPTIAIPVHGERRHILEHADLARSLQIPFAIAPRNGDLIRLAPGEPAVIDEVPAGRLHLDGDFLVPADGDALRDRKRAAYNGVIAVSVALDARGEILDGPVVRARGLPEDAELSLDSFCEDAADVAAEAYLRLSKRDRKDDEAVERAIEIAVRRLADGIYLKRPLVDAIVLRV